MKLVSENQPTNPTHSITIRKEEKEKADYSSQFFFFFFGNIGI
jgi:hypothetical protein